MHSQSSSIVFSFGWSDHLLLVRLSTWRACPIGVHLYLKTDHKHGFFEIGSQSFPLNWFLMNVHRPVWKIEKRRNKRRKQKEKRERENEQHQRTKRKTSKTNVWKWFERRRKETKYDEEIYVCVEFWIRFFQNHCWFLLVGSQTDMNTSLSLSADNSIQKPDACRIMSF